MVLKITFALSFLLTTVFTLKAEDQAKKLSDNTCEKMTIKKMETETVHSLLQRYADYNLWANQQMAKWLEGASEEAFNREIESSFKSLKTTVSHIWNAEYLWLQIMKGEEVANSPAKGFKGSKDQFLKAWLSESIKFSEYLNGMTSEQFQDDRPRSSGKGSMRMVDMIQHCLNHSTYHRGQLITMGRQAGLADPPRTDFIYYVGLPQKTK